MHKINNLIEKASRHLPYIYLLYIIPLVCFTAIQTPPFQNPDEPNHFMRAEQFSRLEILPVFVNQKPGKTDTISNNPEILYPTPGGFKADKGIIEAYGYISDVSFHPTVKVNKLQLDSAKQIRWGSGMTLSNFANTAIYPPVGYVMPVIGIWIGKALNLTVIQTLYISRLLNSLLVITICFFALLFARQCNKLMFIVLLFPMTIALFASVSQDSILISSAFLLISIIDNAEFTVKPKYSHWQIAAIAVLMTVIGLTKPPYALLAFVFLFLSITPKQKAVIIGVPFIFVATWLYFIHPNFSVIFAPGWLHINTKLQVAHILQHPLKFAAMFFKISPSGIVANTKMFIGVLGWLDLSFPHIYYILAFIILIIGFIINGKFKNKDHTYVRVALLISAFITIIAIITVQYITWAPLDSPSLAGMAGRYLLPVFPFVALAVSSNKKTTSMKNILLFIILIFPLITASFLIQGILFRYY